MMNSDLPPLGFEVNDNVKSGGKSKSVQTHKSKKKVKFRLGKKFLVIGGMILMGVVLSGGYILLKQTARIAEIKKPDCGSLMPQDCETVPGCKLETKEVKLSSKCDSLMPQDCETVPGCKLETKTQTITKQCTPDNCDHPGCKKTVVEVGGKCLCDPASGAAGRVLTTKTQCDQYKDDGCIWIPKNQTECSGQYKVNYTNEYCTGTAKYTNEYCVVDPNYKPGKPTPSPKPKTSTSSNNYDFDYCVGTSDAACQGKNAGDECMGGNGTCEVLKVVRENDSAFDDAICACRSKTCNKGVSHGCGAAPDRVPNYSRTAEIGPFPEDGKLVVLFNPLDVDGGSGVQKLIIDYDGQLHEVTINQQGRQRIVTDIQVKAGTTAKLVKVVEAEQHDKCAPHNKPYEGIGWIPVNSDQTCGTGLPGPPQGGKCTPFVKPSVKEAIDWGESFGQPILSKECWADWMEWPGDYDFNDYFIMLAVEPSGVSCESLTKDKETIEVGDTITLTCQAQASSDQALNYEFRYRVDGGNYQTLKANGNKATLEVQEAGNYQVQCRACLAGKNICSDQWSAATATK